MVWDLFLNFKGCLEIDLWYLNCGKLLEILINDGI